jgi:hypothetical protein
MPHIKSAHDYNMSIQTPFTFLLISIALWPRRIAETPSPTRSAAHAMSHLASLGTLHACESAADGTDGFDLAAVWN